VIAAEKIDGSTGTIAITELVRRAGPATPHDSILELFIAAAVLRANVQPCAILDDAEALDLLTAAMRTHVNDARVGAEGRSGFAASK
jgi:hypothetical protein